MLTNLRRQRAKYGLKTYLKRAAAKELDKLLHRVDRDSMAESFRRIGLAPGAVVCVHSSLSRLGYIEGGADAVIDAVLDVIGPRGCLLMPAFSTGASMASYIESGEVFDVRQTASRVGAITEVFRRRAGVVRSAHPTNSVAALGQGAEDFVRDHDRSPRPFGKDTPYGRLAARDDAFILMLETHVHSFLHQLQDRVDFPDLFLPGDTNVALIDAHGQRREMTTRLMRPHTPYFIAVPARSGDAPDWVVLHDFALMFPSRRDAELRERGALFEGYPKIFRRRADLLEAGVLRAGKLGRGEIGLLHVGGFLARVEPELRELIERYRGHYDPRTLRAQEYY